MFLACSLQSEGIQKYDDVSDRSESMFIKRGFSKSSVRVVRVGMSTRLLRL